MQDVADFLKSHPPFDAADADGEWPYYGHLIEGFEELGYSQRKIKLIHRFPDEKPANFQSMAAELVASNVDVLIGVGNNAAPYAKDATPTVPVVFTLVADPVGSKLVDSLQQPGGNIVQIRQGEPHDTAGCAQPKMTVFIFDGSVDEKRCNAAACRQRCSLLLMYPGKTAGLGACPGMPHAVQCQ